MLSRGTIARAGFGIFVGLLVAVPLLVTEAVARGKGGGGGGVRVGGGGTGGVRSFSVARVGGSGVRSFTATRVTVRSYSPSVARSAPFKIAPAVGGGTHLVGSASRPIATAGVISHPVGLARPAGFA